MNRLEAKRNQLLSKNEELTKLLSGGNDLTSDELKKAGDLQAEVKTLKAEYDQYASFEATQDELKGLANTPAKPFVMGGAQEGTKETAEFKEGKVEGIKGLSDRVLGHIASTSYNEAWHKYIKGGMASITATEYKVLQEGIDSGGGFLVPEQMQRELIMKQPAPTNVAQYVSRYQTGRDSLTIPKVIYGTDDLYQTGVRMTKTGEIPTSSTAAQITDPVFGQARIDVYTYMATGQITRDMLEDGLFDVQGFLANQFRVAVDLQTENLILNGTGVGQATGILANPGGTIGNQPQPATVNIGTTSSAIPDGIIALAYALPPQYDGNSRFVFNKTNTELYIAQLKDSQNRYLFAYGMGDDKLASARPKELVGYEFTRSQLMPNLTSSGSPVNNATPIVFGDLTGYAMVERVGLAIQVLDQTAAKLNQIELVGRWRFGGQTLEDWKIKVGKVA